MASLPPLVYLLLLLPSILLGCSMTGDYTLEEKIEMSSIVLLATVTDKSPDRSISGDAYTAELEVSCALKAPADLSIRTTDFLHEAGNVGGRCFQANVELGKEYIIVANLISNEIRPTETPIEATAEAITAVSEMCGLSPRKPQGQQADTGRCPTTVDENGCIITVAYLGEDHTDNHDHDQDGTDDHTHEEHEHDHNHDGVADHSHEDHGEYHDHDQDGVQDHSHDDHDGDDDHHHHDDGGDHVHDGDHEDDHHDHDHDGIPDHSHEDHEGEHDHDPDHYHDHDGIPDHGHEDHDQFHDHDNDGTPDHSHEDHEDDHDHDGDGIPDHDHDDHEGEHDHEHDDHNHGGQAMGIHSSANALMFSLHMLLIIVLSNIL